MHNKIQEIKIKDKRIIYRKEGFNYFAYCRETLLFFMFNQLGLNILHYISQNKSFDSQIKIISKQYNLTEPYLKKYFNGFINSLISQDLIKLEDAKKLGFRKK